MSTGMARWTAGFAGILGLVIASMFIVRVDVVRECPHDLLGDSRSRGIVATATGGNDDIPEHNDCQKFLIGDEGNPRFGDTYAIFALAPTDPMPHPDNPNDPEWWASPAAIIRAWGDYGPLHIRRGYSCLYTLHESGAWSAKIVYTGVDAEACDLTRLQMDGPRLDVIRMASDSDDRPFPTETVPRAARWGFDRTNWEHYAVVPCMAAACFVGGPGMEIAEIPVELDHLGFQAPVEFNFEVPVWHDEQFLASSPSGFVLWFTNFWNGSWLSRIVHISSALAPSDPLMWGAAIPHRDLSRYTEEKLKDGWQPVAFLALSEDLPEYETRWNWGPVTAGRLTRVDACIDDGKCEGLDTADLDCADEDDQQADRNRRLNQPGKQILRWRTRHTNAVTGERTYHCAVFYELAPDDQGKVVPGIVRWRWFDEDETLWFRCPGGCCTPE